MPARRPSSRRTLLGLATVFFAGALALLHWSIGFTSVDNSTLLVGGDLGLGLRQLLGGTLAVLAALFYAGYILSVSRLRSTLSTAAVMTYGVTCAALLPGLDLVDGATRVFAP